MGVAMTNTLHVPHGTDLSLLDATGTAQEVARDLDWKGTCATGSLPFALHDVLHGRADSATADSAITERFFVAEREFHWLLPATSSALWEKVALTGHRLVLPDAVQRQSIIGGLEHLATRPWAFDLVAKYVTTIAFVESEPGTPVITSCSLPDFPLCVFISERVARHIPPSTVTPTPHARLAAENLYHESVHQAVNHLLLSRQLFRPGYSSATSPKVPIYWRQTDSQTRNRAWELDRVLHATAVYCHLLQWRAVELCDTALHGPSREAVAEAAAEAVGAVRSLAGALMEHTDQFTGEGAVFIGRLVEASTMRADLLDRLTQRAMGG
jgi:hypothetical protein